MVCFLLYAVTMTDRTVLVSDQRSGLRVYEDSVRSTLREVLAKVREILGVRYLHNEAA